MKYATFVTEIRPGRTIQLPADLCEKLRLETGDRIEISLKKIKSGKLDLMLAENPLYRLLDLTKSDKTANREPDA